MAVNETYNKDDPYKGPLTMYLDTLNKTNTSAFCKSVDSTPMSQLISRLVALDVPHRLTSLPWIGRRVQESIDRHTNELAVHIKPYDMFYVKEFDVDSGITLSVDGQSARVSKIVIAGPHREARKCYRWTSWYLRDRRRLDVDWGLGLQCRQEFTTLYIKTTEGACYILSEGRMFDGQVSGNYPVELFTARLHGMKTVKV